MANKSHLEVIKQGADVWNQWRVDNLDKSLLPPDLSDANLRGASLIKVNLCNVDLSGANLIDADLTSANLSKANLGHAQLQWANLSRANLFDASLYDSKLKWAKLREANLSRATLSLADLDQVDLSGADLSHVMCDDTFLGNANLSGANLNHARLHESQLPYANLTNADLRNTNLSRVDFFRADLSGANLSGANLYCTQFIEADLSNATLTDCKIFGISAWKLKVEGAVQKDLVITPFDEPAITVDNLEVAQFIYLLLNNERIRDVINTITSKAVLILGRFTEERKAVLDAIREELRKHDYLPILFDFEKPSSRNLTETVSTLAHIARFVIADITDAKSIPQELQRIVPDLPSLPVQPLILESQYEYSMFNDFFAYPWVLRPYQYRTPEDLISSLEEKVILPAVTQAKEIEDRRRALEQMT